MLTKWFLLIVVPLADALTLSPRQYGLYYNPNVDDVSSSYMAAATQITANLLYQWLEIKNLTQPKTESPLVTTTVIISHNGDNNVISLYYSDFERRIKGTKLTEAESSKLLNLNLKRGKQVFRGSEKNLTRLLMDLNNEGKRLNLDLYVSNHTVGFNEEVLEELGKTSTMTAPEQFLFALKRADLKEFKGKARENLDHIIKDLEDKNSIFYSDLSRLSQIVYVPN